MWMEEAIAPINKSCSSSSNSNISNIISNVNVNNNKSNSNKSNSNIHSKKIRTILGCILTVSLLYNNWVLISSSSTFSYDIINDNSNDNNNNNFVPQQHIYFNYADADTDTDTDTNTDEHQIVNPAKTVTMTANITDNNSGISTSATTTTKSQQQQVQQPSRTGVVATTATAAKVVAWEEAMKEAKQLLSLYNIDKNSIAKTSASVSVSASCLVPNKEGTNTLVTELLLKQKMQQPRDSKIEIQQQQQRQREMLLPVPIINMGMPNTGSSSLYSYFNCIGLNTTHFEVNNFQLHTNNDTKWKKNKSRKANNEFEGICMRDANHIGLPPITTCSPQTQALMQLDAEFPMGYEGSKYLQSLIPTHKMRDECYFPQLSLLEEIHMDVPQSTFIINFRPIKDWLHSVTGWGDMLPRFQRCSLPNLPYGVPKISNTTTAQNDTKHDTNDNTTENDNDVEQIMMHFFCSHVIHLRNFVKQHLTHTLIELDLYDTNTSSTVLNTLFPPQQQLPSTKKGCRWEHANQSNYIVHV